MASTFKAVPSVALTTAAQDVYTCPASTAAMVVFCQVANVDGTSNVDIDISWTDASNSNAEAYIASTISIPADAALNPIGGRMVLEAGDKIRAKASTDGDAVITLSIMEIT
jgi:hypothetical protein